MKAHVAFLLSTAAAFAVAGQAQAAPAASPIAAAQSYADLLEPVQNASDVLMADDVVQANQPRPLLQVQWHHHHHRYHHHHHHGFFPGFGIAVPPPAYYGPECYYRRQVFINRWGERVVRRVRVCD